MIAKRIPGILPQPSFEEFLELLSIQSSSGLTLQKDLLTHVRPFRNPHHSISTVGLVGGGNPPRPGEISLAHTGVLFLDELPEFQRSTLETLRQPLEEGLVRITRSRASLEFPTSFMLVAAMNPCPCGYLGHPQKNCSCTTPMIQRYRSKISGPLLDRIELHVNVPVVPFETLRGSNSNEDSQPIRQRILAARQLQTKRFKEASLSIQCNDQMETKAIRNFCTLESEVEKLFKESLQAFAISARAHDRILKVARTIADLEGSQ